MTQRNLSSYLPIIYVLAIAFSIFIIHLSEVASSHYHKKEIRNIDRLKKNQVVKKKAKKPIARSKEPLAQKMDTLAQKPTKPTAKKDTLASKPATTSDAAFFSDLAEKYRSKRSNAPQNSMSRTDIVIRYYKKNKDEDRVYKLRDLGFYIHERPAEDDFDNYASNAIFYGDSVKREDLILIAYNLMESGLKLQSMTLSKFHDAWKAHSVEIGTDTTALNDKPFTLSTLRKKWDDM